MDVGCNLFGKVYINHSGLPWQDVAAEIEEPRVHHSICPLMGRWRYVDDGSEEDDFVLEFVEAITVSFEFQGEVAVAGILKKAVKNRVELLKGTFKAPWN